MQRRYLKVELPRARCSTEDLTTSRTRENRVLIQDRLSAGNAPVRLLTFLTTSVTRLLSTSLLYDYQLTITLLNSSILIMISFTTFILTLLALFSLSLAAPMRRDVFVPPIIYPKSGVVWIAGHHHNVTWETDGAPVNITNGIGRVYLANNTIIDLDHPLAIGFDILDGRVSVQVPSVPTGQNYSLVLFGDSGNYSPQFTIIGL